MYASPMPPGGLTPYVPGYAPVPAPMAVTPMAAAPYQGLLDQLHMTGQAPLPMAYPTYPALPYPVLTYAVMPAPVVIPPPVAQAPVPAPGTMPTFQLPPLLGGLLDKLGDLVDRLFSPGPPTQPPVQPPVQPPSGQPQGRQTSFVISSFNVLGSSHTTGPGSDRPGMAPGTTRIRSAAELLAKHKVDVAGLQEFQVDQVREFMKVAGDTYAVYPGMQLGKGPNVNSIVWRKDTWDLVKAETIPIPYFDGKPVSMPVIRLRHKVTGQEAYFANFHNPASTRKHPGHEKWRDIATDKEIALVNRLRRETGLPVFITGDMNEREEYYQRMTQGAPMTAANTGPKGQPPARMGIDWIFGSKDVTFSNYKRDTGALVEKTSDHPMIVSKATIKA